MLEVPRFTCLSVRTYRTVYDTVLALAIRIVWRIDVAETIYHYLIFASKPPTLVKTFKPPVIVIDSDEGPDRAVSVAENSATNKGSRLMDVVFVIDGEGVLVSFHVVANPVT